MKQRFLFKIVLIGAYVFVNTYLNAQASQIHTIGKGSRPNIAADTKGQLHAVFIADTKQLGSLDHTVPDICYTRSADGGTVWTSPLKIPRPAGAYCAMFIPAPDIAVEPSGAIDIVWSDTITGQTKGDIFFTRSTDAGKNWTNPVNISKTIGESMDPILAIGKDNSIHVVWQDTAKGPQNWDIYYSYSADGGKKWGKDPAVPAENISNTLGCSSSPRVAVDTKGVVHVIWLENLSGQLYPNLCYVRKTDGAWTKPIKISRSSSSSYHPGIACSSTGKVYVVWSDSDNFTENCNANVWCAVADQSDQFNNLVNISNTAGVYSQPSVAVDQVNHAAVVWSSLHSKINKPNIYVRISNDCGNNFSKVVNLLNLSKRCSFPSVVIADNKLIIIWEEISYDKNQGGHPFIKVTSLPLE